MTIEDTVRGIVESNRKTRAELSQLSARVVHATLSDDPGALDDILADLDPGLAAALQDEGEDTRMGGGTSDAQPGSGAGGATTEP